MATPVAISGRLRSVANVAVMFALLSFLLAWTTEGSYRGSLTDDLVVQSPAHGLPFTSERLQPPEHLFTLRHIYHHGASVYPGLHRRKDVGFSPAMDTTLQDIAYDTGHGASFRTRTVPDEIERLVDRNTSTVNSLMAASRREGKASVAALASWTTDKIMRPDTSDKETVLNLARMAANAYVQEPEDTDWEEIGRDFQNDADFGWEEDGIRGHVFVDEGNSTVVISLKGTSLSIIGDKATSTKDQINDNLFAGCCCGQQGQWTYRQVCDCATGTFTCNSTCVTQNLKADHQYYAAAQELYANITAFYPDASVWLTGHSLGGAVAALLGLTYGLPAVTFEAVPDALAASRLGLPAPPGTDPDAPQTRPKTGIFHFGHTADPVFMGTCNGALASCTYAGFAFESACHTGNECTWDVVADKGWRVSIATHRILSVIRDVILPYDELPSCVATPECRDCAYWNMS